jgi:hypothetical protein
MAPTSLRFMDRAGHAEPFAALLVRILIWLQPQPVPTGVCACTGFLEAQPGVVIVPSSSPASIPSRRGCRMVPPAAWVTPRVTTRRTHGAHPPVSGQAGGSPATHTGVWNGAAFSVGSGVVGRDSLPRARRRESTDQNTPTITGTPTPTPTAGRRRLARSNCLADRHCTYSGVPGIAP